MGKTDRVVTRTPYETRRFFKKIAKHFKPGDVIGFSGELGTGKTTAIQSILENFGLAGGESPTFVMVRPYRPSRPKRGVEQVVHLDAYRFQHARDAETAGVGDIINSPHDLVLVEWADRIREMLPKSTIWVNLSHGGEDVRNIEILWP